MRPIVLQTHSEIALFFMAIVAIVILASMREWLLVGMPDDGCADRGAVCGAATACVGVVPGFSIGARWS
jgi:hypothetical protein